MLCPNAVFKSGLGSVIPVIRYAPGQRDSVFGVVWSDSLWTKSYLFKTLTLASFCNDKKFTTLDALDSSYSFGSLFSLPIARIDMMARLECIEAVLGRSELILTQSSSNHTVLSLLVMVKHKQISCASYWRFALPL